jgi:TonB family protein
VTPLNTERTHAGSVLKNREYFQTLDLGQTPRRFLGASVVVHIVLFSFLILFPLLAPQTLHLNYRSTMLAPPPPKPSEPRQMLEVKLTPKVIAPKPIPKPIATIEAPPPPPPPPPPKSIAVRAPEVRAVEAIPKPEPPRVSPTVTSAGFDPKPITTAPPVQPPVVTNVFSTTASTAAAKPTRNTEAAGFGETATTTSAARSGRVESATAAGFGEVAGSSDGSRGGKRGGVVSGVVGGFDGGVVGGTGTRSGAGKGAVAMAGFVSSAEAPKAAPSNARKEPDAGKIEKPVEILVKPRPEYTDEARKQRIEGEVLVRVSFSATGEVRVIEVIRGLGYGLNENAIRAAEQIRFKPAQRSGQSIDSTAIVHIVFQLAY